MTEKPVVVGITGASGAIYAVRMLQFLSEARIPTHVVISRAGALVMDEELGLKIDCESPDVSVLGADPEIVKAYSIYHLAAPIASGTFPARGMIIIPTSTGTLGAMASGIADNLIRRAAEVMLKEGRKLILVLRETPLNLIHLENCVTLARAGATILPASPGFYHGVTDLDHIVNFILTKSLDQLGIESDLIQRWGQSGD